MFRPPPPASAFEDLRSHYETARQQYMTDIQNQSIVWEKQKELELKKQLQKQSIAWEKQREQEFINKYNGLFATEKQKLEKIAQDYVQKLEDNIEQLEKEIAQLKDDVNKKKELEKEIERLQSNLQKVEINKKEFEKERNNILKKEQQQNKEISDCKTRTSELTLDLKDCHSRLDSKKTPTPKRPTPKRPTPNKGPPPTRPTTNKGPTPKRTPPRASSSRDCEAQFNENYKRFETTQNIKGQLGKNSDDFLKNIEKIVKSIEKKHGVSMIRKLALILHSDKYSTCSVSDNSDFLERINQATLKITQVLDEHKK